MNEKIKNTAVVCKGVTKTFRNNGIEVQALRGIDIEVRAGELFMLVGPSGSGKTTLISVIAGILEHDEGECFVYGTDLNHLPQDQKTSYRGENIGFIFQAFNLIPMLTAQENVSVPLILLDTPQSESIKKAEESLAKLGLKDKLNSHPYQLSGGEQQRVAIARSIIHNPNLIVCDEPTSSLDHATGKIVMEILKEIALKENRAVIVVTHDARIFDFADRIAKMDDGKIVSIE